MTLDELRTSRLGRGLSQMEAAARLKVSQPYLAMLESGKRRLTSELARRAMRLYGLPPTAVPPPASFSGKGVTAGTLAADLAALGYPGLAYLRPRNSRPKNPGEVLLTALAQENLEARLVEALPWLLLRYAALDRDWLVREAKVLDLQNRLGFVVTLACRLAERAGDTVRARTLRELETVLERSRLALEDTLCRASMPDAERRWLTEHRSVDARRWNVVTDWTPDAVRYIA